LVKLSKAYLWNCGISATFLAVGEEQHFRRAAQRLRVAQPALSRQIQMLEEEIGFQLFERLPRGARITDAGTLFLEDARRLLQEIHDATARAKCIACGQSGTLRVGVVESISWHGIVPESFKLFRGRQPDAELQLIENTFALMWRKENNSALLAKLVNNVNLLVEQKGRDTEILDE
jgi:DNA-binding transcriptional LysR family regulator